MVATKVAPKAIAAAAAIIIIFILISLLIVDRDSGSTNLHNSKLSTWWVHGPDHIFQCADHQLLDRRGFDPVSSNAKVDGANASCLHRLKCFLVGGSKVKFLIIVHWDLHRVPILVGIFSLIIYPVRITQKIVPSSPKILLTEDFVSAMIARQ